MITKQSSKLIFLLLLLPIAFLTTGCDDDTEQDHAAVITDKQGNRYNSATMKPITKEEEVELMGAVYYTDEEKQPEGAPVEIFKIGSDLAVENGGKNASVTINNDVYATELWTYHYNYGKGAPAGTIQMVASDGTVYGPWQAKTRNTYYWVAVVNQNIPAGTYTIIDSNPATWSQNADTGSQGITWMMGIN